MPPACRPRQLPLFLPTSLLSVSYTCLSVRNRRSRRSPLRCISLPRSVRFLLSVCLVGKARPVSFRLLRLNRSAKGHGPDNDEDIEEDEGDYGRDVSLC